MNEPTPCITCLTPIIDPETCEVCGKAVCPDCACHDEDLLHVWCEACAEALLNQEPLPSPPQVLVSQDALKAYIDTRKSGDYERMKAAEEALERSIQDAPPASLPLGVPLTEYQEAEQEILCWNPMDMARFAHLWRADGHDIAPKMEAELGYMNRHFLGIARQHGLKWREVVSAELREIQERGAARATQGRANG